MRNSGPETAGPRKVLLDDRVEIQLVLKILETSYKVWGCNVKQIVLDLTSWGLTGQVEFWLVNDTEYGGPAEDTLFAAFVGSDPIALELTLSAFRADEEKQTAAAPPLIIKALVEKRAVQEQAYLGTDRHSVLARRYSVTFADAAALLWRQHHPLALYTDKPLSEVIDAHKGDKIALTYSSELLTKKRPLIFLAALPEHRASFYDLLMWQCDSADLLFSYSYKDQSYRIGDEAQELPEPTLLGRLDVGQMTLHYPPVPRYQPRVLNSYTEDPRTQASEAAAALQPLWRDHLVRTPIAADFDARASLESKRLRIKTPELRIDFSRLPVYLFGPGDCVDLTQATSWQVVNLALPPLAKEGKLRVVEVTLSLQATEPDLQQREGGNVARYTGSCSALLELHTARAPRLPSYVTPDYPQVIEGKIVSEQGAEDEETYDILTNEETKLRSYKVKLPIFTDQIVSAPFLPTTFTGHFYFPAYKNARVLCALGFDSATITGFLDWRAGAEVPLESQGNQLFLGKKLASSITMTMVYKDGKPTFTVQRCSDKDTQIVQMSEGVLSIFVGEGTDGQAAAKICTMKVTLDKQAGARVTVENPDAKITQTVQMDGTTLLLQVQGENDTSKYTQVADTITIAAKNINVQAETLSVSSTKTSTWNSDDTLTVTSKKAMSLSSETTLSLKATEDATLSGKNVIITADSAAKLNGSDVTANGSSSLKASAPSTTVEGTSSATFKGATVEVSASAALTCKSSASTTLKGSLVSVEGSLIKVG